MEAQRSRFKIKGVETIDGKYPISFLCGLEQYLVIVDTKVVPEPNQYCFFAHSKVSGS